MHQQGREGYLQKRLKNTCLYIYTHTKEGKTKNKRKKKWVRRKWALKQLKKPCTCSIQKAKLLSRNVRIILAPNIRLAAKSSGSTLFALVLFGLGRVYKQGCMYSLNTLSEQTTLIGFGMLTHVRQSILTFWRGSSCRSNLDLVCKFKVMLLPACIAEIPP